MISVPITSGRGFAGLQNRETAGSGFISTIDEPIHTVLGSPLDLTAFRTTATPAGSRGQIRVSTTDQRKLEESANPGAPVRFHICTWQPEDGLHPLPDDHAYIDAGVAAVAAQGYNAIRIQGIEYLLMNGTTGDFALRQDKLDDFDYLLFALKRAGIYWIFQPFSYSLYRSAEGGSLWNANNLYPSEKPRMHIQQESRDHWLTGFNAIYNRVNKYTGMNNLRDPALLMVSLYNENAAIFAATSTSIPGYPFVTRDAGTTQGTCGMLFGDWLADPAKAHGYADLAALNTSWGSAHASFTAAAASQTGKLSKTSNTQRELDAMLHCRYLDANTAQWFKSTMLGLGYTGLTVATITFPTPYYLAHETVAGTDDVWSFHQYAGIANAAFVGAHLDDNVQKGIWERIYFAATMWAYDPQKPTFADEIGWPYWGRYRNQYPITAAYAAVNGASGFSWYGQGNIFENHYDTTSGARTRVVYPYEGTGPTEQMGMLVSFFALHRGYVTEPAVDKTLVCNPKYVGWKPRSIGRIARCMQDFWAGAARLPAFVRTRFQWDEAATDDTWFNTHNSKSLFTWLDELKTAGSMTADNLSYISANANHGAIVGFDISAPTLPVMQVESHTLTTGEYVSLMTVNGSGAGWIGSALQTSFFKITVIDATHLAIWGLDATGWVGSFTSGTWCEGTNVVQSANKEIGMSVRHRYALIDAARLKFLAVGSAPTIPAILGMVVNSISDGASLAVISLDGLPVATSEHLLIGMVGEDKNTGTTWDAARDTMTAVGDYPIQIMDCTANITMTVANSREMHLYRLQRNGARSARETPASINAATGAITLNLRTGAVYPSIWFELIRKI